MESASILLSVVSHGQGALVLPFLRQLAALRQPGLHVVMTLNVPEDWADAQAQLDLPLRVIRNARPKGFGANHNAAFSAGESEYFCVANPDIRMEANPFPALLACLRDPAVGVAAPRVTGGDGRAEDNARRFPTFPRLARKLLHVGRDEPRLDYAATSERLEPDWVAGMFMMFKRENFAKLGGFDERYFLYYEDVDLCARLRLSGLRVVLEARAEVIHLAQRQSRRSARYALWHARSMARWLRSPACRQVIRSRPS